MYSMYSPLLDHCWMSQLAMMKLHASARNSTRCEGPWMVSDGRWAAGSPNQQEAQEAKVLAAGRKRRLLWTPQLTKDQSPNDQETTCTLSQSITVQCFRHASQIHPIVKLLGFLCSQMKAKAFAGTSLASNLQPFKAPTQPWYPKHLVETACFNKYVPKAQRLFDYFQKSEEKGCL